MTWHRRMTESDLLFGDFIRIEQKEAKMSSKTQDRSFNKW